MRCYLGTTIGNLSSNVVGNFGLIRVQFVAVAMAAIDDDSAVDLPKDDTAVRDVQQLQQPVTERSMRAQQVPRNAHTFLCNSSASMPAGASCIRGDSGAGARSLTL